MKHSVSNRKELTILKIEEEVFDFRHGEAFRKAIESLIGTDCRNLIVDFSRVKAIDSSGIGSMLHTHQMANQCHGLAIFVSLCQQIKELLKLTNLDKQLYIFSSINEVMTLVEPAMKSRKGSKSRPKSASYGMDDDEMDEINDDDIVEAEGISDEEFDSTPDDDDNGENEGESPEDAEEDEREGKKSTARKRGRPRKTETPPPAKKGRKKSA